ncbi:TMEM175 family protein [Streptomyces cavernae]|uniref:TMEM175 family protein n=1 Tax=Streptomyces cavernae TaxID=2259034 RepID=UPI001EE44412|nr:TMEM175 family protein [Streptomyces cavernae]
MTDDGRPVVAGDGAEGGGAAEGPGAGTGTGAQRLAALSDGVFAIAMTLLVLDVSVPAGLDDAAFREALGDTLPNLAAYALSFAVIAQFWREHRHILDATPTVDGAVTGLALLGLALVALLPFPTALLAEYTDQSLAVAVYSATVAATNAAHVALMAAIQRRIVSDGRPAGATPPGATAEGAAAEGATPEPTTAKGAGAAAGAGAAEASAQVRERSVDAGTTALVFGLATPLAFLSPAAAMWFWLTLIPLNVTIGRRQRRRRE